MSKLVASFSHASAASNELETRCSLPTPITAGDEFVDAMDNAAFRCNLCLYGDLLGTGADVRAKPQVHVRPTRIAVAKISIVRELFIILHECF